MKFKANQPSSQAKLSTTNIPITQRRLKTKPTLILLALLFVRNLFWFILWLIPNNEKSGNEQVAAINDQVITRQQWLSAMEERYGKETLQNLVNETVMQQAAKEYDIKVTEEEIAKVLDVPVNTVKTRLRRAKQRLESMIKEAELHG